MSDDGCFQCPSCLGMVHQSWEECSSCDKPISEMVSELSEHYINSTHKDDLRELVEHLREQQELTADEKRGPIHGSDYGNGVSAGLDYAAEELEGLIDE